MFPRTNTRSSISLSGQNPLDRPPILRLYSLGQVLLVFKLLLDILCLQQCLSMERLVLKNNLLIDVSPFGGLWLRACNRSGASASDYSQELLIKRLTGGLLRLVGLHQSIRGNDQGLYHILKDLLIFQTVAFGDVSNYFLMESVVTSV